MSAEVQSMVIEVLRASLGEDSLAWDMNESNLPREFRRKGRLLTIRWIPVFDSHGVLQRLLISIVDVTKERELEKAVGFHKKQLQSLPDILHSLLKAQPDLVKHLLASTGVVLSRLAAAHPRSAHPKRSRAKSGSKVPERASARTRRCLESKPGGTAEATRSAGRHHPSAG